LFLNAEFGDVFRKVMSLIRKTPSFQKGDLIRLKDAAEIIGCDASSLRKGDIGDGMILPIKLGDTKTAPLVVRKADVDKFIAHRIAIAERSK
jgi:hypothetical protein